jgi:hypothetical protein
MGLYRSQLTTNRNYFAFTSTDGTGKSTGLYRFDDNFGITYSRLINKQSANQLLTVDMDFNTDYSLSLNYVNTASALWNVMVLNETTGATIGEMTISVANAVTNMKGAIRLDTSSVSAPPYYLSIFVREASTSGLSDTVHIYKGALAVTTSPVAVTIAAPTVLKTTEKVLVSP